VASLNGLVTNDVAAFTPGQGGYAAALTAKGKLVADLRIFMWKDGPLVDTSSRAASGLRDMFKKYVNPRFATITDVTDELCDLGVFGDDSARVVAAAAGVSPDALMQLDPYGQLPVTVNGATVIVAHVPELGVDGYDLFVPSAQFTVLSDVLRSAGATPADAETWRALRVAAGWPEWGADMDENTLPQEANLDALHGISYDKGCYIGQETVARIHFRGHVNRTLRRLSIEGQIEPPTGAELFDGQGKSVGDVRSTALQTVSGEATAAILGGILGIGMVRREIEDGMVLTARWGDGETPVHVLGAATGNAKGAID
jgi:folate-binding protein YgfZ